MPVQAPCPTCNGQKSVQTPNGQLWQACPTCNGSGRDPGQEIPFQYVYDRVLTANEVRQSDGVSMLGEADFVWKAVSGVQTGNYRIRFGFGGGGYMSSGGTTPSGATANDRVRNANLIGTGQFPFPIFPHVVVPRSGRLLFDIEDLTGAPNTVQICFIGALIYPTRAAA